MTREESGLLLNELISLYPNLVRQSSSVKTLAELWNEALQDKDYAQIHAALIKYFKNDTKGYVPTAGQLIEIADEDIPFAEPYIDDEHPFLGWDQ